MQKYAEAVEKCFLFAACLMLTMLYAYIAMHALTLDESRRVSQKTVLGLAYASAARELAGRVALAPARAP
jgi:hypothetical protein